MTDDHRITELSARIDQIDQHGTRGMESVRAQLGGLERDLGKLESSVGRIEAVLQAVQLEMARTRPGLGAWMRDVALITPMYALVVDLIVRGVH